MKKLIFIFYLLMSMMVLLSTGAKSQSTYFPPLTGNSWDTISPTSLGWCQDKIDTLINYLGNRNTKAFILLKDGKIVIEKYFGTFTQDSVMWWHSAGKTLIAFTVGIAQQEGFLTVTDTSSKYLGDGWTICPPAKEDLITIKHQLSMTSGLDDGGDDACTIDTCLQYLADAGTRWAYHNGPYTPLLDGVIPSATGQSLNLYFTAKVKNSTGITGAFFPYGDYDKKFLSTPRSMARFGLLILNNGNWNGNQIMTDTTYFNQMVNTSQLLNQSYGYLWWLNGKSSFMTPGLQYVFQGSMNPNAPNDMIAAIGGNGQLINVVPSQNIVFIRMGGLPSDPNSVVPITFNDTIWQKLNTAMCIATSITDPRIDQLQIYPNPATEKLTIVFNNSAKQIDLKILNVFGQQVFIQQILTNKTTIDISQFTTGIYFVRATTQGHTVYNQKIIITK